LREKPGNSASGYGEKQNVPFSFAIEIGDNGPYGEQIRILKEKEGLILRGKRGHVPLVFLAPTAAPMALNLVTVEAPAVTIERVALIHRSPPDRELRCPH